MAVRASGGRALLTGVVPRVSLRAGLLELTIPTIHHKTRGTSRSRRGPRCTLHGGLRLSCACACACAHHGALVVLELTDTRAASVLCADLLDFTLADEELSGGSQYRCDNCHGLRDARKALRLSRTPRLLVLQVVRTASAALHPACGSPITWLSAFAR